MTVGTILLVILGVVVLLALWAMAVYNGLVVSRNRYKNAYAQIDVQLKRRYDLIPNLIECVKGYMGHEKSTLEAVVAARTTALAASQRAAANPAHPPPRRERARAGGRRGGPHSRGSARAAADAAGAGHP